MSCTEGSIADCRACSAGRLDSAQALVEGGKAKLEAKDASGATPMGVAASCGDQHITLYLLSKGSDPEVQSLAHVAPPSDCCTLCMLCCKLVSCSVLELQQHWNGDSTLMI